MKNLLKACCLTLPVIAASSAIAQTDATIMLVPWEEGQQAQVTGYGLFTPTEANVTGADVDLSIFDADGRIRLDPGSSYNPTIGFEYTHFNVSTSDAALPDDLADVSVAFGGSFGDVDLGESLGGVWQMGFTVGIGYSGTNLFGDSDGYYGKADVYAINNIDRDTRWIVGINYDGNRVFLPDVPLPSVVYFGRASETVTYAVGVPFSRLTYKPDDYWTIDLRTALFFSFRGSVSYQATEEIDVFLAYVRRADAFTASGGPDNRRFLFQQQRVEIGFTHDLPAGFAFTVAGGFAFDQEFEFGYDRRDPGALRVLDDSGYVRASIELKF